MNFLKTAFKGKFTYVIGACGLVWGLYEQDLETIVSSLALLGVRRAID